MSGSAFRLKDVAKTYAGGTAALSPTNLDIARGSFISLVGPSGCGKSTLLKVLAGLIAPSAGTIERHFAAGDVGYVFQDATLMPWASVRANVALPLSLRGQDTAPAAAALERVGLSEFADTYPRALSGGMQMRASIARAIVTNPHVLLMDEPFAALDEFTRFRLNDDLHALWRENKWTVIFVTHSIREAVFLSQRVVVISPRPGRVLEEISIRLPERREPALRASHALADQCAEISAIVERAMNAGGGAP